MTKTVVDQRLNLTSSGRYRAQWITEGSFEVFVVFPRAPIEILIGMHVHVSTGSPTGELPSARR